MSIGLIVGVVALWLGTMLFAGLLSILPQSVRIVRPLICPPGTLLDIRTFSVSYGRQRAKGLTVEAVGPDGRQEVKGRALIIFWGLCCLACALPSAIIVLLVMRLLASLPM